MGSKAQALQQYEWKNRILVVYSNEIELDLIAEQFDVLTKSQNELSERKILLLHLHKNRYKTVFPEDLQWKRSSLKEDLNISTGTNFEVFLIGLDGSVKLRQQEIIQPEKLFSLIDGMPMRKAEIKREDQ